jgi:aryl-alcohol dehydrogenase-like predicted oxidoreductase
VRYHLLGQTGAYVSELCLGTMTYGDNKGIWEQIGSLQQEAVNEQVKFAVEAGINFMDTANAYSTCGADCTRLAFEQAVRQHRDHRRKIDGSIARQHRFVARSTHGGGNQDAR